MITVNKQLDYNDDLLLSQYLYELPESLIAQSPAVPRDSSRLLVVDSSSSCVHSSFSSLADWLDSGDLLVLNNTSVIPARLYGKKKGGAVVEILLLEEKEPNCWLALVKPGKRFKIGSEIEFRQEDAGIVLRATVVDRDAEIGGRILKFALPEGETFWSAIAKLGEMPLPPYITSRESEEEQYQTIFATEKGAVAAPTAGLHFTEELFAKIEAKGIERTFITLHVGVGTFRPVEAEEIVQHQMHQEWIDVSAETIAKIEETKARGGRVIAVGTTAVRALEGTAKVSQTSTGNPLKPFCGKTDLFIYPGYQWQVVDGLITNFHLPGSSLLMLVSGLIGRERLLQLYQEAIASQYRFYSFGDAMLILPSATKI